MERLRPILKALKPASLLGYWSYAVFLVAVLRLFFLDGFEPKVLFFFLFPIAGALICEQCSPRLSSRFIAVVFLMAVDLGVALAPIESLLPNLRGIAGDLSPKDERILSWYAVVYLAYVFCVLPLFLFTRGIIDHFRKVPSTFSVPTCLLGLIACAIVSPLMAMICPQYLGLSPLWKPGQMESVQASPDGDGGAQEDMRKGQARRD